MAIVHFSISFIAEVFLACRGHCTRVIEGKRKISSAAPDVLTLIEMGTAAANKMLMMFFVDSSNFPCPPASLRLLSPGVSLSIATSFMWRLAYIIYYTDLRA